MLIFDHKVSDPVVLNGIILESGELFNLVVVTFEHNCNYYKDVASLEISLTLGFLFRVRKCFSLCNLYGLCFSSNIFTYKGLRRTLHLLDAVQRKTIKLISDHVLSSKLFLAHRLEVDNLSLFLIFHKNSTL